MAAAKAPKEKAAKASTPYQGVNSSTFGSDFGTGTSTNANGQISTTANLNPQLEQAQNTATSGLNSNLSYLAQSPTQVYQSMQSGDNPYYTMLQDQTANANASNIGQARLMGAQTGNNNSTTLGSELGTINANNALQQATNAANAYTLGNTTANQNVATNQGELTSLANLVYPLGTAANSNLLTALNQQQNNNQYNATNQQTANNNNLQSQIGTNAANQQLLGDAVDAYFSMPGQIASTFGNLGTAGASASPLTMGSGVGATSSVYNPYTSLGTSLNSTPSTVGLGDFVDSAGMFA